MSRVPLGVICAGVLLVVIAVLVVADDRRQPAEQAAPATSCELDLIEARDAIGDLLQERDDLRERLAAAEGRP